MGGLKKYSVFLVAFVCLVRFFGCANVSSNIPSAPQNTSAMPHTVRSDSGIAKDTSGTPNGAETMLEITLLLDGQEYAAKLYNNETTRAFVGLFPLEIQMIDLNGNEKYYNLLEELPTNSENVSTIHTGDIMLYGSNCLVLFYKSFQTSYNYTRLGYVEYPDEVFELAGTSSVDVTFRNK